jgi:STE24 endopeptidase
MTVRDFVDRVAKLDFRFKAMQVVLYGIPLVLLLYVLSFPLTVYENFFREHAYGMATQNFAQWFGEQMIMVAVTGLTPARTSKLINAGYAGFTVYKGS